MDYCSFLHAVAKIKQLKPLYKLLNAAVRFIFGLRNSIPIRLKCNLCFYMYKVIYGTASRYLCALLANVCHLDGIHTLHLIRLLWRRILLKEQSQYTGHTCDEWNVLPCEAQEVEGFKKFKKNTENFLFLKSFWLATICLTNCSYQCTLFRIFNFYLLHRSEMLESCTSGGAFFYRAVYNNFVILINNYIFQFDLSKEKIKVFFLQIESST